jgi:putative ABC transport system substrate-binding protein
MIVEPANEPFLPAFRQGLQDVGYADGKGLVVEYRHVGPTLDRVPEYATELVRLGVGLLVVPGTAAARMAKTATATVPIVFVTAGDPVGSGLVASLARPGGNATGLSVLIPDLSGKQLELLKAAVPKLSRLLVLYNPDNPGVVKGAVSSAREAGRALGVEVEVLEARK